MSTGAARRRRGFPARTDWDLRALLPLTPGEAGRWATVAVVLLALLLAQLAGGYAPSRWAPAGIALVWLLVAVWALMRWPRPRRELAVVLGAYALLTVWSAASIAWADAPGRALDATGRTAIYGMGLAIALLPRWPRSSARQLLALVTAGATLLAVVTLLRMVMATDPSPLFIDGRLVAPLGYVNATAGLWLIALGPAVFFAAGGARSPIGRVLALASAGLLVQILLLSQSRGALLAAVGVAVLLLTLTPYRGATALVLAAVGLVTALGASTLLHVRGAPDVATLLERIDAAWSTVLITTAVLVVAGVGYVLLLGRLPDRWRRGLAGARVGNSAVVLLAVGVLIGGVAAVGNPVTWVQDRVDEALHDGYTEVAPTGSRLTGSLGSNRGDMYRVAWDSFRAHPLQGIGAEDFQGAYLRDRRSDEAPRYAHSLPMGVLSGLGAVGGLLWLVLLGGMATGIYRARRRGTEATRALGTAATVGGAAWLLHSAVDWTWEFPALSLLAFVLLGVAMRIREDPAAGDPPPEILTGLRPPRSPDGWFAVIAVIVLAVVSTAILGALGSSSRYARAGTAQAQSDPPAALRDLQRAARWNPLESDALLSRAVVARKQGDTATWNHDLRRALQRSPDDWFARLELGLALTQAGDRRGGLQQLRQARALNPRQPAVRAALEAIERGRTVSVEEVEAQIAAPLAARLRPTGGP